MLNSSFVRREALGVATWLIAEKAASDAVRVEKAYRLLLGRSPSEKEIARAAKFLAEYESLSREKTVTARPAPQKATESSQPKESAPATADPDEVAQIGDRIVDAVIEAKDPHTAAWLAFVQALFGSAEFRYVR